MARARSDCDGCFISTYTWEVLRSTSSDQAQLFADPFEGVQRVLQILARVRGGHERPDSGLVARDGREGDRLGEHALLEQAVRKSIGFGAVAGDHRRDRALAQAGVEAKTLEACFEEPR